MISPGTPFPTPIIGFATQPLTDEEVQAHVHLAVRYHRQICEFSVALRNASMSLRDYERAHPDQPSIFLIKRIADNIDHALARAEKEAKQQ
jgi:hypothetical protein